MKKEIVCVPCARRFMAQVHHKEPKTLFHFEAGNAREAFTCDRCGCDIKRMGVCVAFTFYTVIDQFCRWWDDFIYSVDEKEGNHEKLCGFVDKAKRLITTGAYKF